jgi:hypothetical protein
MKDLATAMAKLIPLERQAFNLDAEPVEEKPVRDPVMDAKLQQIYDRLTNPAGLGPARKPPQPAALSSPDVVDQPVTQPVIKRDAPTFE